MKKIQLLSFFNLLALAFHIGLAYMTQLGFINGKNAGQVSDEYNSLFTPAEITFGIWGVVYLCLLFCCMYHLVMASRNNESHHANICIKKIGPWFILNNLGAAAWLYLWTNEMITLSVWVILFQLVTIIMIHLRAGIHDPHSPVDLKIFTQFPLSTYFGWLSFAAVANISIYLLASGWKGFGVGYSPVEWTRIIIGALVFLTLLVIFSRRNVFFGLVIIWGLYGIILKRKSVNGAMYSELITTAWIGMGIIGLSCIIQFILNVSDEKKLDYSPELTQQENKMSVH